MSTAPIKKPGKDDVHEQRAPEQPREGAVPAKPRVSQSDAERADWEGMGQSRYQPEPDEGAVKKP